MIELKFGISSFKEIQSSFLFSWIIFILSSLIGLSFKNFKFGNWDNIKYAYSWVLKSIFNISKLGIVDNDNPIFW